ncbi:MAG: ATP-binding cassette domain-containing protein [Verrucomicrobiota bacterium]
MIRFENIFWRTRDFSLENISFTVPTGSYAVLMGRTGCGKTSIVEMLCGLRTPASGRLFIGTRDITEIPPGDRSIGYVPQDAALFHTMSIRDNIGFALRIRNRPRSEIASNVEALAERLSISHLLERRPEHLSGGERQRVALGRALAAKPAALVLDEPLSAVDDDMRLELIKLLKEIQRSFSITALHITHHRQEALQLADCLFRIEAGVVQAAPLSNELQ